MHNKDDVFLRFFFFIFHSLQSVLLFEKNKMCEQFQNEGGKTYPNMWLQNKKQKLKEKR